MRHTKYTCCSRLTVHMTAAALVHGNKRALHVMCWCRPADWPNSPRAEAQAHGVVQRAAEQVLLFEELHHRGAGLQQQKDAQTGFSKSAHGNTRQSSLCLSAGTCHNTGRIAARRGQLPTLKRGCPANWPVPLELMLPAKGGGGRAREWLRAVNGAPLHPASQEHCQPSCGSCTQVGTSTDDLPMIESIGQPHRCRQTR